MIAEINQEAGCAHAQQQQHTGRFPVPWAGRFFPAPWFVVICLFVSLFLVWLGRVVKFYLTLFLVFVRDWLMVRYCFLIRSFSERELPVFPILPQKVKSSAGK